MNFDFKCPKTMLEDLKRAIHSFKIRRQSKEILDFSNQFCSSFLLPAEGWEVYKRGSLSVCQCVCVCPKNSESSQKVWKFEEKYRVQILSRSGSA